MLKIQPNQVRACDAVARATFQARLKEHLNRHFPEECSALGDAELVKLIENGIDQAATHAIEAEEGVAKFVTLMLVYGRDFDTDPQHGWASTVLKRKDLDGDPISKADLLYEAAVEQARIAEGIAKEASDEEPNEVLQVIE